MSGAFAMGSGVVVHDKRPERLCNFQTHEVFGGPGHLRTWSVVEVDPGDPLDEIGELAVPSENTPRAYAAVVDSKVFDIGTQILDSGRVRHRGTVFDVT